MAEAPNSSTTETTGKINVVVGCKLPHGLYLDLRNAAGDIIARHKLAGNAGFSLPNPERKFKQVDTSSTFGDTMNIIPKDHWDEWRKRNKDHAALRSGAIYVAKDHQDALAQAREHQGDNVGFDKIDPKRHGVAKLDDRPKPEGA